MSLFSRLFRKAPSATPVPAPASTPPKPSAADRAAAAAAEQGALQSAIDARDAVAVARLVVAGTSSKIRQAAAEAIDDPDVLRQLIREVRGGNDKNVYKVLTAKRDALLEQARKQEQLQAEIDAASAELERHSQRAYDARYGARLDQYERRWQAVAAQADAALRGRVEQWTARAREIVAAAVRAVEAQAAREQAAAEAAAEARRLREAQAQAAAEQAQALEAQRHALEQEQGAEQQAVREISELIRKARGALSAGSTARAAGLRRTIEDKLADAAPAPAKLLGQIQALDKQLDELKDWKNFTVAPKRAELIDEMESLIGAALDPQALADRIQRLKDDWRTLGKGVGRVADADADPALEAEAQRFHDAARKAFEPCREYFAAQALVREQNLQRRKALLETLTAFEAQTDWAQADWPAVIKLLRETKDEWRRCSPVDRVAGKPQQEAFSALTAQLQGRLDAEYARNEQQKQALIERAQALLASDDVRAAIDAIKRLQQQWRTVGPVPRAVDQRLWETFRQHCDAVFQKREQASAAQAAGLEHNKAQAIALCEQIEQIAALEGAELLVAARNLGELRSAFEALGELPRADVQVLRKRLDRALDRCQQSVARQHARDAEQGWNDLFEAADQVRAYRLALVRHQDAAQIASLKAAAETGMAAARRWPKGGLEALGTALADERATDLAANASALRMLCIRAEILADLPTPPEDQALRRDYQLQRLVQNLGQGQRADATELDTLAIEWLGVGPVEDAAYAPLLARFRRCREHGNVKAAGHHQ
jgi:hypothetical protein